MFQVAVVVLGVLLGEAERASAEQHQPTAVLHAGLLYVRQTGPQSDYVVYGAPGVSPPHGTIEAVYADGDVEFLGLSTPEGAFAFGVSYEKARSGLSLRVQAGDRPPSQLTALRLDYPMQSTFGRAPNERGFVHIVPASADVDAELSEWIEAHRARTDPSAAIVNTARLKLTRLEDADSSDVVIYGYSPEGEVVTCINGPSGYSVTRPLENGSFQVTVPGQKITRSDNRGWSPASFTVTITTEKNEIVATTSINPWPPHIISTK